MPIPTKDKRRIFYEQKIKLIFFGYIFLTFVLALLLFGNWLVELFVPHYSQIFREHVMAFSPTPQFLVFYIWTIYGYFLAYIYAISKINGVVFRLARIFDQVKDGEIHAMSFRKNDPFHPVAESFNNMLNTLTLKPNVKNELIEITQAPDAEIRSRLEEFIQTL